MKRLLILIPIIFLITALTNYAQEKEDYSKYPGYVDFGNLAPLMNKDNITEVNIDGYLLYIESNMSE